jgi:hypothetical protein
MIPPGDGGLPLRTRHPQHPRLDLRPCVNPNAAGLDIGSEEMWACVPEDRDAEPVRPFGTFTPDLYALADWLAACRIETVAMESTGVYGIPVYEILEARHFKVHLVNARHLKHVPGRKNDEVCTRSCFYTCLSWGKSVTRLIPARLPRRS